MRGAPRQGRIIMRGMDTKARRRIGMLDARLANASRREAMARDAAARAPISM
ncbi:Hypothetical protein A7982_10287 [Minicystis rosea]|nr:Hypothetical protein A7982_10287 [Minicystis rosea]